MMETEPTYDQQQQQQQQRSTTTRNKAGEFGRPLIPFFLNEDANGETPTGGYSVNEDLFLTDEQAQQQERVFVPKGEKSIRVREFKDGYFEYKDLSFDGIQEKLTFHSPIKQQQQQANNNSNQPQFFSQHVENNKNNSSNGNSNGNGNGFGKTKTSSRDHFANYERMVIPYQHKNNMTKSNDNSSSSDENKLQSDEDKREEEDKKAKKKKQKKKVMVPINVQKQNVSSRNTNHLIRNHENQPPSNINNNQSSNQEFISSSSQQPNYQQQSVPVTTINHTAGYPQVLVMHSPLAFNSPSSPTVYPKPNTNQKLLTPSLLGINRSASIITSANNSSPNSAPSPNGLLKPSALLSQSLQLINSTPVKPPTVSTIPPQKVPTHFPQQSYDVSYLENNILPQYYQEQPASYNYSMNNGSLPNVTTSEPVIEQLPPISQMVSSSSSTSLTEKELLSILMNDGSVNFTPDEPENLEQKHKKFAGGSWSNSPHPSEIPKPNFK